MLLTLTTTKRPATDLGYLLHKNPARCQSFPLSFGQAHVFYPEAAEDRCTAALLLDVDPVAMVRGRGGVSRTVLAQYVNDRPYVASSFMSVAIAQVLRPGAGRPLQGTPGTGPHADPAGRHAGSAAVPRRRELLARSLRPLGYEIDFVRYPLDETVRRLGSKPVLLLDAREDHDAQRAAHASLRPDPGLRQLQALLRRRRGVGKAAEARRGLAGGASQARGHHAPLL